MDRGFRYFQKLGGFHDVQPAKEAALHQHGLARLQPFQLLQSVLKRQQLVATKRYFRDRKIGVGENHLAPALAGIAALSAELGDRPPGRVVAFDLERLDWFDLRNMLTVARSVAESALNRTESRGAHQREDFPAMLPQWQLHQHVRLADGEVKISGAPAEALAS